MGGTNHSTMCNKANCAQMSAVLLFLLLCAAGGPRPTSAHEPKHFDDSILYKIDFDIPDPNLYHLSKTFTTPHGENYQCVIPVVENAKTDSSPNDQELSPYVLLEPLFSSRVCSYKVEAYWSYEICHGQHVRQYHKEREGKSIKSQEYFLGNWSEGKTERLIKSWDADRKAGVKYKTIKIDNTNYPYFEFEMTDGSMCDIIKSPRVTLVRYVCFPDSKNVVFSVKEVSSCNYEAIILSSALCRIPAFHPEVSTVLSIKCANFYSTDPTRKPLAMLREELRMIDVPEGDFRMSEDETAVREAAAAAAAAGSTSSPAAGDRYLLKPYTNDIENIVFEVMATAGVEVDSSALHETEAIVRGLPTLEPFELREFIFGKNCLIGGTGWWKFEYCYGRYVRQFHQEENMEGELMLGFFSYNAHRKWIRANPDKAPKAQGILWHHYEDGAECDRTGVKREVNVKLMCTSSTHSSTAVSMYLHEPTTCHYILVVESPIICELVKLADDYGLVQPYQLDKLQQIKVSVTDTDLESPLLGDDEETTSATTQRTSTPAEDLRA